MVQGKLLKIKESYPSARDTRCFFSLFCNVKKIIKGVKDLFSEVRKICIMEEYFLRIKRKKGKKENFKIPTIGVLDVGFF